MKKIFILLALSLSGLIANAQCSFTHAVNGNMASFNHVWPLAGIYSLDSIVCNYGDGTIVTVPAPVPVSTNHTYAAPGVYNVCYTRYISTLQPNSTQTCTFCDSVVIGGFVPPCTTMLQTATAGNNLIAIGIASGGISPYTYSYTLNPGNVTNTTGNFTGLANGTYTICVTATDAQNNVCLVTCGNETVSSSSNCATTLQTTTNGNTITATGMASGGTAPYTYTYALNPGNITNSTGVFGGLANGIYTICVTAMDAQNNTCMVACVNDTVFTTGGCLTNMQASVSGNTINAASIVTGGVAPYTYSYTLNPGNITNSTGTFTGLNPGLYVVCGTATDANQTMCSTTCDTLVVQNTNPTGCMINASFTETINGLTVNFTQNATITNGTITNYAWSFGDGSVSSVASPAHTYTAANTYNVVLTVIGYDSLQNICIDSFSKQITVSIPNSVNNINTNKLDVYPNPTASSFVVKIPTGEKMEMLTITDATGRKINTEILSDKNGTTSVSLLNQASGIYFIKLQTNRGLYTSTIMKQE